MRGPCRGPEIEELDNQLPVVSAPEKSPKRRKQPPKNVSKERIGAWHQFASQNPTHYTSIPSTPNQHQTQKVGGTNLKRWVAPIEENAGNEGKTLIRNAV
jgi:hypothetical protein